MNRIDAIFQDLRAADRKAFIPFLTAGDPSLDVTGRLVDEVVRHGADLIEIGFPYSDPIADGAVIQASYVRALAKGLRIDQVFDGVRAWSARHAKVPFVAMTSYSLVQRRGPAKFLEQARAAGLSGAIVPDLPFEESDALVEAAAELDFKLIQLVTPTTPHDRAIAIARRSTGFLYCVSVTGITGARQDLPPELCAQLTWLRQQTDLPLCVGFGISKPEHARMLKDVADGIIVGSAIVRLVEQTGATDPNHAISEVGKLVQTLKMALT